MKRILFAFVVLCAVGTAYAEREVFAPTILAPVATGANGKLILAADTPFITGGNIYAPNNVGVGTTGSNFLAFFTNTVERYRITNTGVLLAASGSYVDVGGGKLELPNATALPATCTVGELFHDTDSNDCINTGGGDGALCICKTTNTWALISNF